MSKKKKRFRIIRNTALIEQHAGRRRVTADDVREIMRGLEAEQRQMQQICPQLNRLIEQVFRRNSIAIALEPWSDDAILYYCLSAARLQFFEMRAHFAQQKLRSVKP